MPEDVPIPRLTVERPVPWGIVPEFRENRVARAEFEGYEVPPELSVRLDKEIWEVPLEDTEAAYKIRHWAYLGDRSQKVALGTVTVPSAGSGAAMSRVEQVYLSDSYFVTYVEHKLPDWWERKTDAYHGKVAATRFEAAWGMLWHTLVEEQQDYGTYCEVFDRWLVTAQAKKSTNASAW